MMLEQELETLKNFSKLKNDKEFSEFAEHFSMLIEANKHKININNLNNVFELILNSHNLENSKFAYEALLFVTELKNNSFVKYNEFFDEFKLNNDLSSINEFLQDTHKRMQEIKAQINEDLSHTQIVLLDTETNEFETQAQLVPYTQAIVPEIVEEPNDAQQELFDELNENIFLRNVTLNVEDILENENYQKSDIDPNELLAYIKDEKQIYYPFDMNETLDNSKFMNKFNNILKEKSNAELKELISCLRAKNNALKAILKDNPNDNNALLQEQLKAEVDENKELNKKTFRKKQ